LTDRVLLFPSRRRNPAAAIVERDRAYLPGGTELAVYASTEMLMPVYLPGTAPIATPDQIVLVLGDFRGDVWLMELT
jgi:hypothetical protein